MSTSPASVYSPCPTAFSPLSASAFVQAISPGWNLGNTLDATPTEGSWNNAPVLPSTFDDVKAAGFKSVRIPVTYTGHYVGTSPSWTIDTSWLQRVSDVIDMATSRGLYVITNMHHDSWMWADVTQSSANITMIQEKFHASWLQIGTKLACKSSLVAFEPINEPPAKTERDASYINDFNTLFLKALADSGGYNSQRVVTLVGGGEDALKTTEWFVQPSNITNPWAIQFHYYSPYDFIFSAWGKTIWGSDDDKAAVSSDLSAVRQNFTDIPLVIGEYGASPTNCEAAARWKYYDYLVRKAASLNMATLLWDNGADHFDRSSRTWRDPTSNSIITNAAKGVPNSLPDSTTDSSASTQTSSAYVYHRVGDPVIDYALSFTLNGNSFSSITLRDGGVSLVSPKDYYLNGSTVTLTSSFLSQYISAAEPPGSKANLTLTFSAGAPINVEVVQWDHPLLSSAASVAIVGSDLAIPVTYKGLHTVATVRIAETDGTYLFDDWTRNLGPLQRARGTFNSQWSFDNSHVIIMGSAIQDVVSSSKSATFTFEFYPRVPYNAVNYTLAVEPAL